MAGRTIKFFVKSKNVIKRNNKLSLVKGITNARILLENLPEYLHGIDRQADELYESMYAKLSQDERYKRTGNFMEDYRRQTEIQRLIEEEILSELVYVD